MIFFRSFFFSSCRSCSAGVGCHFECSIRFTASYETLYCVAICCISGFVLGARRRIWSICVRVRRVVGRHGWGSIAWFGRVVDWVDWMGFGWWGRMGLDIEGDAWRGGKEDAGMVGVNDE